MSNKVIEGFQLSPQQGHLWSLQQHDDERAYRAQAVIAIEGSLDPSALEDALNKIVSRHEILRTAFRKLPGMSLPLQIISNDSLPPLPLYDLSYEPLQQQGERLEFLIQEIGSLPIDLEHSLPMHVWLVKTAANKHTLLMSISALCMDTIGLKNLFYELAFSYANRSGNEGLACEPMQYADFSDWQNEILTSEDSSAGQAHWQHHDFSDLGALSLPLKKNITGKRHTDPKILHRTIDAGTLKTVAALASRYDVSVSTVLLASFHLLLWRLTQQPEVVTGVALSCRNYGELETALGLFTKYVPLRSIFSKQLTFAGLLREVERQQIDAEQWQEFFSFSSDGPHTSFNYEFLDEDVEVIKSGKTQFKLVRAWGRTDYSHVLLRCLRQIEGSLIAEWHYDTRLYETGDIERLADEWQTVLHSVNTHPDARVEAVNILGAAERAQLLINFNQTSEAGINTLCLHELVEAQVKRTPDAVAVELEDQRLTYRELDQRANRLARFLQRKGVAADARVAILIERSLEMVVGLLGILKAGGAYVPLDSEYPVERLALMLQDSGARVVVTQERLGGVLRAIAPDQLEPVYLDTQWHEIESESHEPFQANVNLSNLGYVIYTSGSTGRPKGVLISHEGICNRVLWIQREFPLTEVDSLLQKTPISFDASVWEIFVPLLSGARLVLAEPGGHRDSAYLVETIAKHRITNLQLVPSMLRVFLDEPQLSRCEHLRRVFCGGESLPVDLQQKFFERMSAELCNLYGPTETSIDATFYPCKVNEDQRGVLIGHPISNIQVYLLDSHLEPVPIGCSGELHVGGIGLARGYLNRPDLTAESFIPNAFSVEPGQRLYRTGDLARYLPDGTIEYLGRIDHQVKLRGFRVELGEIEAALCAEPAVKMAVVVVREDGPDQRRLVAYIVPEITLPVSVTDLRSALLQKLPEYMVPSAFVMLAELPRLPNGKIDRAALPAPEHAHSESLMGYVAPRDPVEETLQQIWQQVLGITQIGIHDNFFELGGDSILSIQIVARANQAGLKLSAKLLFRHQTIAELSQVATSSVTPTLAQQGLATGRVAFTPIQHYFFEQSLAEQHHFNQSVLLEVRRRLTARQLQRVIEQLVLHHDALRLRFKRDELSGEWQQYYAGEEAARQVRVEEIEFRVVNEPELEAWATEFQRGLNLEHGPLMRVALIELGPNRSQRLLLVIHHLAVDGVSWRILLDDLERGLGQDNRGESLSFGPKTTSFGQWRERLTNYAQSSELLAELDFWSEIVHAASALPLPLNREERERTLSLSHGLADQLEVDETRALLQDVPAVYHTQINDVLLAALVEAIGKWSGERRIAVEMEGHGREEISEDVDLSRTIGWFTSIYPVVLDVRNTETPGAALKAVKEQLRSIPNGGIGFGVLRYLSSAAQLRTDNPVELSFNYLGQLDQVLDSDSLFGGAREAIGPQQSLQGRQRYALEVAAAVVQGKLSVRFIYNEGLHATETIQEVLDSYMKALRDLIAHCQSDEAGGFTPSDFPLIELNQQELDLAFSEVDFG